MYVHKKAKTITVATLKDKENKLTVYILNSKLPQGNKSFTE